VIRRFSCPSCGALLDSETALPGEPFLEDVVLG
jgi:acetone carboxylase gamma subunit